MGQALHPAFRVGGSGFLPASVSTRWGAELDLGALVRYPYPSFTSSVASGSCVRS